MTAIKVHSQFLRSILLVTLILTPWLDQPALARANSMERSLHNNTADVSDVLLQFQSGGHVMGFAPDRMYISNGTYALQVSFVDANMVTPQTAENGVTESGEAPQLTRVTYSDLWDGITLVYEAADGLARSTYTIAPGADPAAIRLRYNKPVAIEADGSLRIDYETGTLRESTPVAWQEINGQRIPVEVAFQTIAASTVSFCLGRYNPSYSLIIDPTLTWNAFLGGNGTDYIQAIAVDVMGNVYVAGESSAAWGSPVRAYSGGYYDAFAAKLSSSGNLIWHTFLGGNNDDYSNDVAVDSSGNVYVVGRSYATWSNPVQAYSGSSDTFVSRLSNDGSLTWNTFLGGSGGDQGESITTDDRGNIYVAGRSDATWGNPVRAYSADGDAFVAELVTNGNLVWNTFLGGSASDFGNGGIAVDDSGNVYIAGTSYSTWGCSSPTTCTMRAYTADSDVYAAKLDSNGSLTWNTFLGGNGIDHGGDAIAVDDSGSIYVMGFSMNTWGNPVRTYTNSRDAFVASLSNDGNLTWNTFLGGSSVDSGYGITVDSRGSVYVVGTSNATWGAPLRAYSNGYDAFAAGLGSDGSLTWNTFLGEDSTDYGADIAVDSNSSVYVAGSSGAIWGSPTWTYNGGFDGFVAKLGSLALTKSVRPTSAKPGEAITYTIAFGNTEAVTATNVVITDTLSDNITGASYTSSGVGLTHVVGSRYVWAAPDLAQNGEGMITVTGTLIKPLTAGIFTNTVTLAVSGTILTADVPLTVLNTPPVADAGDDQTAHAGTAVTLDGSASSDANGDVPLTYAWTRTGGTTVTFTTEVSVTTFTAPATSGGLTFTLMVTDSQGLVSAVADEVVIMVTNDPPVADASDDQTVYVGTAVTLDGSSSNDADGDVLTYGWAQTGGSIVTLNNSHTAASSFTAPGTPTVLTFTLWITDSYGLAASAADDVVITINDMPVSELTVKTDSPTTLGRVTIFTATTEGSNLVYTWNFGDGSLLVNGSFSTVSYTYPAVGTYTAVVTATNSWNSQQVSVPIYVHPPMTHIYLPLVSSCSISAGNDSAWQGAGGIADLYFVGSRASDKLGARLGDEAVGDLARLSMNGSARTGFQ